jgi:hypothetical protein
LRRSGSRRALSETDVTGHWVDPQLAEGQAKASVSSKLGNDIIGVIIDN